MNDVKTILLVEDDENDVTFTKRAISKFPCKINLIVVHDGKEALDLMNRHGIYSLKKIPNIDLILMDINIPKINGLEVLRRLRENGAKKTLPIIILSSSQDLRDLTQARLFGANSYVKKPSTYKQFDKLLRDIIFYWFNVDRYISI